MPKWNADYEIRLTAWLVSPLQARSLLSPHTYFTYATVFHAALHM